MSSNTSRRRVFARSPQRFSSPSGESSKNGQLLRTLRETQRSYGLLSSSETKTIDKRGSSLLVRIRTPIEHSPKVTAPQYSFYSALAYAFVIPYIAGSIDGVQYDRISFVESLREELQDEIADSGAITPESKLDVICQQIRKDICILDSKTLKPLIAPSSWRFPKSSPEPEENRASSKQKLSDHEECILLTQSGPFTELVGARSQGNSKIYSVFRADSELIVFLRESYLVT